MIARCLAVGVFTCMMALSSYGQRTLENLVSDASADWMFGKWQAETENGDTVSLNASWDLDKHVLFVLLIVVYV